MSSKYIIVVEDADKALKDEITTRLSKSGYGYWHWMENLWLVAGVPDDVSPQTFGEWLELTPGFSLTTYLILNTSKPGSYWGRCKAPAWDWIYEFWK